MKYRNNKHGTRATFIIGNIKTDIGTFVQKSTIGKKKNLQLTNRKCRK